MVGVILDDPVQVARAERLSVMLEDLLRRAGAGCARAGKGRVRYPTARGWVRRVRAEELEGGLERAACPVDPPEPAGNTADSQASGLTWIPAQKYRYFKDLSTKAT